MSSPAQVRCAVVGGGPQGLLAAKSLKEDGFDVTLYETRAYVGGLWKYSDDESLSTAENTTFNSSKYRIAATDFPVPDAEMDDFATAAQMHKYLEDYCDHFGLRPHVRLSSRVAAIRRVGEQWSLEILRRDAEKPQVELYDKVVLACGTFVQPKIPHLEGSDRFAGQMLHAINYHQPERFRNKNILIIGIHNTAQDVLCSSHSHGAKKVFMSHRRGLTLISRYGTDGSVYDRAPPLWFTILSQYVVAWFPNLHNWAIDGLLQGISKKSFPNLKESWGLSPSPSIAVATPVVVTDFYNLLDQGFCEPVPDVKRITGPKTVEMKDGSVLEDIDAIIYATGYYTTIPVKMEPAELNPHKTLGGFAELYRGLFPLHADPKIRNSLAFLCQGAVPFPGFAQFETQSMCISQIWLGKKSLPPLSEMQRWHRETVEFRRRTAKRHNISIEAMPSYLLPSADHMAWLDATAGLGIRARFGLVGRWINWKAWSLWWNDKKLYNICLYGLTSPAIFRLFDEGGRKAWPRAREQIFIDNERAEAQQKRKFAEIQKLEEDKVK